jgi:hypothetical protein
MAPGGVYAVDAVKKAFGMPTDLKGSNDTMLQMVWGPGTFGYSRWPTRFNSNNATG